MFIPTPHQRHGLTGGNLEDLNAAQRKAAATISGPVLILAGAGTGKTRVITTRICHLLRQGVRPEGILAVTFTNKAANEMRERVGKMISADKATKLTIATFHSLCVRILRQDIEKLGYKKNFTIYTQSEQTGLIRRIILKNAGRNEKLDPGVALSLISKERNKGVPASTMKDALINVVKREYERQLKLLNAVDFDDLLVLAGKLLREFPDVKAAWKRRYDHIMVDEFQDTNKLQMELMQNLAGAEQNVCVVGDDDQSIYGWRGAEMANILEFEKFFPNPTVVTLEENYRSTNPILNTANGVIKHNRERRAKKLFSSKEGADPVRCISMPSDADEAEFIVQEIELSKSREELKWEDFAILFRTNSQTRAFETQFRNRKIPYRVIGGMSFFDRREIKDILAWLHVIVNPQDDINLLRIINTPPRGIGETVVERATEMSAQRKEPIFATLCSDVFAQTLSAKAGGAIAAFAALITRWQEELTQVGRRDDLREMSELAIAIMNEVGYLEWLKRQMKDEDDAIAREASIGELLADLKARNLRDEAALVDWLANVSLEDNRESSADELDKQKGVSLITMHASKGLEFPIVYLPGLEEGILPHQRSVEEGTKEEERRLLYVGITRAMKKLTLTWCATRIKYGQKFGTQGSSFIRELDRNWVQFFTADELRRAPVSAADVKSGFAALRAMAAKK